MTPLGEDSWKLAPGFLWTLPRVPFPFIDFALYPFAFIDHYYEYDSAESSEYPSGSTEPGDGVGTPQHNRGQIK